MNNAEWWSVYIRRDEILCMLPKWRAKLIACALRVCGVNDVEVIQF